MTAKVFTPKQIAQALGVSESSVKRWVDSGRLAAAKTAGGHRKVPLRSLIRFVRQTGHELIDPTLVGMVSRSPSNAMEDSCDRLFDALVAGQEVRCREMLLSFYQRGDSITRMGDRLIGPVFNRIGDGWADGTVQVHQERRACEIVMATLHELRRWLPTPSGTAPEAFVATPLKDFAEVPARLIELVLISAGWRVTVLGSGLPLEEIRDAIRQDPPRLLCLSATHLDDPAGFVAECNRVLLGPLQALSTDESVVSVVGGSAFCGFDVTQLACNLFAPSLADLVVYQGKLRKISVPEKLVR